MVQWVRQLDDLEFTIEHTTHALPHAAGLKIWPPSQGSSANFNEIPIDAEVSFHRQHHRDETGFGFDVKFKNAILDFYLSGGQIKKVGQYEKSLSDQEFLRSLQKVAERNSSFGGKLGFQSKLSLKSVIEKAGFDAHAAGHIESQVSKGSIESFKSQLGKKIVKKIPQDRWRIGHEPFGEPREIDGALNGAYFWEAGDGRGQEDEANQVCLIEPLHGDQYSIEMEVRAKRGDFIYIPIGEQINEEKWKKRNKEKIEKFIIERMLQESNKKDGIPPPEDEVVLARTLITVKKLANGGGHVQ